MSENLRLGINTLLTLNEEIKKRNFKKIAIISDTGLEEVGLV